MLVVIALIASVFLWGQYGRQASTVAATVFITCLGIFGALEIGAHHHRAAVATAAGQYLETEHDLIAQDGEKVRLLERTIELDASDNGNPVKVTLSWDATGRTPLAQTATTRQDVRVEIHVDETTTAHNG